MTELKAFRILKHHFRQTENGFYKIVGVPTKKYFDEAIKELNELQEENEHLKRMLESYKKDYK